MRTLSWQEVDDILLGATALGCGGGGDYEEGRSLMRRAYDAGRAVRLAAADEIPDDARRLLSLRRRRAHGWATSQCTQGIELSAEYPGVLAVRALGEHLGVEFGALITGELGGTSISDAFYPAAILDLPVVDADPVGRAVPELAALAVQGARPADRAAGRDQRGRRHAHRDAGCGRRARRGTGARSGRRQSQRRLGGRSRVAVGPTANGGRARRHRSCAARRRGHASRPVGGGDAAAAAAAACGGRVVFRGRVDSFTWEERDGFTWGELELAGEAADAGSSYRVWSKNENLLAWRDGEPDVTAPDLVCCFSGETGAPVTNPHHSPGALVDVVGVPAAPQWRTAAGIATLGPRHFGFDLDYRSLERPAG